MAKRILLIDDERDFTELTKTLLSFHDYDVDAFNDPQDVKKLLDQKTYDLVVTDLMMPHIDGFELVSILREKADYKNTPIIVLSAKTLSDRERKILLAHSTHFFTKPFEPQGLVEKINELLGQGAD